jgi:hypothetical protein
MREYRYLTQAGVIMILLGLAAPLPFVMLAVGVEPLVPVPGLLEVSMIASVSLLFIGAMCAISGYVGYKDEMSKWGKKRVYTTTGRIAMILGIVSVLVGSTPVVPLLLGFPAILLGYKAYKDGDLENGEIGMGCGAIGVAMGFILIILFAVWGA